MKISGLSNPFGPVFTRPFLRLSRSTAARANGSAALKDRRSRRCCFASAMPLVALSGPRKRCKKDPKKDQKRTGNAWKCPFLEHFGEFVRLFDQLLRLKSSELALENTAPQPPRAPTGGPQPGKRRGYSLAFQLPSWELTTYLYHYHI